MSIQTAVTSSRRSLGTSIRHIAHLRTAGLAILCAGLLAGCDSPPVEMTIETQANPLTGGEMTFLVMTSKVDKVQIKGVTANRGNCKVLNYNGSPHLQFGNQFRALMFCNGNPIQEAEVETDTGKFSYSF